MTATLVLDCRGLRCPIPVTRLAQRIIDVEVDGVVDVVADDPAARADIPAWCRMKGHAYLGEDADSDGIPVYRVRRSS
jgi:TusA-related sulfurtransferase